MTDSQTKVLVVLRLMKPRYTRAICAYGSVWMAEGKGTARHVLSAFDIPLYEDPANWQDSLVERNAKDGE
jgi:hypothetical protein